MAHRIFTVARADLAVGDHILLGKGDERVFVRITGIEGDLLHFTKRPSVKLTGKSVQILDTLSLLVAQTRRACPEGMSKAKPQVQGNWTAGGRRSWVPVAQKLADAAARKAHVGQVVDAAKALKPGESITVTGIALRKAEAEHRAAAEEALRDARIEREMEDAPMQRVTQEDDDLPF